LLTFLNPAALLALTGLLVPVAIHLWNRRPGREVAVGSLRWLAAGANRRLRNLKLEQLWLLLLRAALLAVLAVALAGPVWRQRLPASRGVVLLSPGVAGNPALATLRPTIDSLRRRGYALRWLAAGFPTISGARWRAVVTGRPDSAQLPIASGRPASRWLWARAQQAAATFAGQPLYVVTPATLPGFAGAHKPLPATVTWQTVADTTTSTWLAAAQSVGDSLQLLVGRSRETGTTFRREKVLERHPGPPIRVAGMAALRFHPNKNGGDDPVLVPAASLDLDKGVGVDAVPMVITLYATPEYAADAHALEAALQAAALGLATPPQVRRMRERPTGLSSDWTFWLSDEPLPPGWQKGFRGKLWREAAGPGVADTTQLVTSETPATIFRRTAHTLPDTEVPVWTDGRGRSVLTRQQLGAGTVYQLHTRLNSAWSELADDPNLPSRLLALLQPEPTDDFATAETQFAQPEARYDRRALDPAQLVSTNLTATKGPAAAPQNAAVPAAFRLTDLRPWLVLAAGLLFLLERLLARRREASSSLPSVP
jgi:hypothetical protein